MLYNRIDIQIKVFVQQAVLFIGPSRLWIAGRDVCGSAVLMEWDPNSSL